MSSLFDSFKRDPVSPAKIASDLKIQIDFSKGGPFLQILDREGRRIEADHRHYDPPLRDFLYLFNSEAEKSKNSFDWFETEGRVYIDDNPYILGSAIETGLLTTCDGSEITVRSGVHRLACILKGTGRITSTVVCEGIEENPEQFSIVSREYILAGSQLIRIQDAGESYSRIPGLRCSFEQERLNAFLSLFFSHFPAIRLDYRGYTAIEGGELVLHPALTFSNFDSDGFLHITVSCGARGFDPGFFSQYDVQKAAVAVDVEEVIYLYDVPASPPLQKTIGSLKKILNKLQRDHNLEYGYFQNQNTLALSPALGERFIGEKLSYLTRTFHLFGTEHLAKYNIRPATPSLRFTVTSGSDFLSGECEINLAGQQFSPAELLGLYHENRYIPLNSGEKALIHHGFIARLERILKLKKGSDDVEISFFDLPAVEETIEGKITGGQYKKIQKIFRQLQALDSWKPPRMQIEGTLRNYQEYGYKWLSFMGLHNLGACLADDMGLGKTVQTIALLSSIYKPSQNTPPAPSLLIMPKSLVFNWKHEFEKFAPQIPVYVYYGNDRDISAASEAGIIITTYTLVRNNIAEFSSVNFEYIILDEAQNIKNINSKITKAVMLLSGRNRIAVSGTPMENNLMELYSLFRFLNPAMFGSSADFTRNYLTPIQKEDDDDAAEDLRRKIYPFILRRLKRDVAKDLPEKVEQILYVEMGKAQRDFYESRKEHFSRAIREKVEKDGFQSSQMFIFQALSELRQIATVPEEKTEGQIISAKRNVVLESLDDVCRNHHKAIIFSNYIGTIEYLAQDISALGYDYLFMSGATKNRMELVEKFQNENRYKVFLMTLKTGGVGLTLTEAEYVYIMDPWWNIAAENQAVDRAHRIGQKNTVFSYKLIAQDTIEERILQLQEHKRELFNTIITNDHGLLKKLNEEDMEFILS